MLNLMFSFCRKRHFGILIFVLGIVFVYISLHLYTNQIFSNVLTADLFYHNLDKGVYHDLTDLDMKLDINDITEDEININSTKLMCIRERKECRYDDIGDFLEGNKALVHKPLSCIPSHRRIPHEKANDWPYIYEQRIKPPEDGSMTALMDYNAFLIPLYNNKGSPNEKNNDSTSKKFESDLDPSLLDSISGRYHSYFSDEDANKVKYLSISRSSNIHSCKPKFKFRQNTLHQGYFGLSLLDENLSRIDGTDIAINVNKWLLGNMTDSFHDFYVVPTRTSERNPYKDQFFLFVSSHIGTFAFPIDIRRAPPSLDSTKLNVWNTKLNSKVIPPSSYFQYGDGIQVRFMDNPDRFSKRKSYVRTDVFYKERGIDRGKNFHVFESTSGETYMEMWPYGQIPGNSHVTVPINFFASKFMPHSELNLFPNREFKYVKGRRFESIFKDEIKSLNGCPDRSFQTKLPKHERSGKRFRGTSTIIDMELNSKKVKVGISHTVSEHQAGFTDKRAYLSNFYAFLPDPPFEIVAISGSFCFNHMHEDDVNYSSQWVSARPIHNRTAPILIMNETYRCPIITFASSMIEKIGNDGKDVIITYGVNDCYSRSIIVSKKKIEILLLGKNYKEW